MAISYATASSRCSCSSPSSLAAWLPCPSTGVRTTSSRVIRWRWMPFPISETTSRLSPPTGWGTLRWIFRSRSPIRSQQLCSAYRASRRYAHRRCSACHSYTLFLMTTLSSTGAARASLRNSTPSPQAFFPTACTPRSVPMPRPSDRFIGTRLKAATPRRASPPADGIRRSSVRYRTTTCVTAFRRLRACRRSPL